MSFVYLASPYSHADPAIRWWRYQRACEAAARLMEQGLVVFSPIAHSHPIAQFLKPGHALDFDFWMRQDLPILRRAERLFVLQLDGWQESRGVTEERRRAAEWGITVEFVAP